MPRISVNNISAILLTSGSLTITVSYGKEGARSIFVAPDSIDDLCEAVIRARDLRNKLLADRLREENRILAEKAKKEPDHG